MYAPYFTGQRLLRQMLQQAKNEGLTIKVRHAKILFCGAAHAGKTSFSRHLRNEEHEKVYKSTPAAIAQQVLISDKVNVLDTNSISLDSKLETQQITNRLILKLQTAYMPNSSINNCTSTKYGLLASDKEHSFDDIPLTSQAVSKITHADSVTIPNLEIQENMPESQFSASNSDHQPSLLSVAKPEPVEDTISASQQIGIEEQMATYTDGVNAPISESISETWDLFTLLDTGGQPEFINMLPAINSSTAITFVVLNMSNGKACLNNLVTAQYKCEEYNYNKCDLKYTNMHLLKCLLSSVKVAATKQDSFLPEIVEKVTEDKHPKPVVCVIGTCADLLKKKFGKKYHKEILQINTEITQLVESIDKENALVFWCRGDNFIIPVDNTLSRKPQKKEFKRKIAEEIKTIREHSNEILKKKAQYEIPISWFILELELRNNEKVCIPLAEVKNICDRIMPSHRTMEMEQIIEVLKFYHMYGMLLYFHEVKGMKNFVITNPQWLFINLTKIIICKFKTNANDLYDSHLIEEMNKGICSIQLLRRLDLDLQGIELESFINLLVYLKVIAPMKTMETDYFIPTILPPCNEKSIFTEKECGNASALSSDRECIAEIEPLLIEFTFGTIPRGLFGFLIVQLLQDNPDSYEVYGKNDHTLRRCCDLICFYIKPCWYVSLCDKVSHLELQVRTKDILPSYHNEVLKKVTEALKKVCDEFNWPFSNCRYGFLCRQHEENSHGEHLTLLPTNLLYADEIPKHTCCNWQQPTALGKAHSLWFEVSYCGYTFSHLAIWFIAGCSKDYKIS